MYVYLIIFLSIHVTAGHLGCLHILAMVNNVANSMGCRYLFKTLFSFPLGKYPEMNYWIICIFIVKCKLSNHYEKQYEGTFGHLISSFCHSTELAPLSAKSTSYVVCNGTPRFETLSQ